MKTNRTRSTINTEILLELVKRWRFESQEPDVQDGSPEAEVKNAVLAGMRSAKRDCAGEIMQVIDLFSVSESVDPGKTQGQ